MSHAEILRSMGADQPLGGGMVAAHPHQDALLAGAAALTALDRVRDALTKIDRLEDRAWTAWKYDGDMYEQGRSDAYDHAHTIITEALGDTDD